METFRSAVETPILSKHFFPSEINWKNIDDLSDITSPNVNNLRLRSPNESKADLQQGENSNLLLKRQVQKINQYPEFGQFFAVDVNDENDPNPEASKKLYKRTNSIRRNL